MVKKKKVETSSNIDRYLLIFAKANTGKNRSKANKSGGGLAGSQLEQDFFKYTLYKFDFGNMFYIFKNII